ncbi:Ankyrin protein [Phytophthora cinnamomi]|uniref:Ankyrin protein n=1 Tax=Phytophthora cinnamomi TaxID=4785 RepID=UPI0035598C36|nr:Ankyrin protein [Phytophthora cinnamomi]
MDSTFVAVRVVIRLPPDVDNLGHVVRLLHEFLFPDISLEAIKHSSLRLFLMTLHAVESSEQLIHYQKLQQYRYAMYLVPNEMKVKEHALTAMKLLNERYRYPHLGLHRAVDGVVRMGYLPALQ